ncbi:MAG: peptidase, partial [Acidimicrobiales bacterium]
PRGDLPFPIGPQVWRFRQSVEYSLTANRAVLDYASRYRETLLSNIYRMGRNAIERGSRDSWTVRPQMVEAVKQATVRDSVRPERGRRRGAVPERYFALLRDSVQRDPRGYVLPADQPDFPTATKFVNALIKNGVAVERATGDFVVAGTRYPAGSYVVRTAQAFRPHIMDMFEPQDHPNDFEYPGGPPIPPYDNAGYTLAIQMGVAFDRIREGFSGPFERIDGLATPPPGTVAAAEGVAGFVTSHGVNDAAIVVNRLLAAKVEVQWLTEPFSANGRTYPAGTIYLPARAGVAPLVRAAATQLGVSFESVAQAPAGAALRLRPARVALWDRYGGSMPSGWTRWLLEQFEFPFEVVYPQTLDAGRLARRFDVLILPDGAVPAPERDDDEELPAPQPDPAGIPPAYRGW